MNQAVPILFTIPNFITAGSGREMLNIVERLDRERFAPTIGVLRRGGGMEAEIERLGIPLLEAPFSISAEPLATLPFRAWKSARLLRPHKFALWHSFHWSSDFTEPLIARMAGAKAWVYTKKNMNWNRRWRLRTLLASRVAARNRTMMEGFFASRWYRAQARLILGGVDVCRFSPDTAPRLRLREELGLCPEEVIVACVAQMVRVKGHPTLLRATAENAGIHLWLVGKPVDADYVEELRALADTLGIRERVHFLGPVSDVPALLAEADMFVLPTSSGRGHEEGCPVALLEAMASGKACIATDVAGSRDVIEHGTSGLLVTPDDPASMAEALRELIVSSKKRRQLGLAARCRVEAEFTLEREAAEMQVLYEEMLR